MVRSVVNFLVGSASLVAMAYIVYGGLRMILSRGNEEGVKTGKQTIFNAITGLFIVLLSYLIVSSVTSYLTGYSFNNLTDQFIRR
jgi:uncharacterized membrane protein